MKIAPYLAFLLIFAWGCNNRSEEMEKRNAELQNRNDELQHELTARDTYVDTVTQSINDVYVTLEGIRSREQSLLSRSSELETAKKRSRQEIRESILQEIAVIDSTIKGNRVKLNNLQSKVNSYRSQYAGLKKLVQTLQNTITEREQTIAELQQKVTGLETELGEKKTLVAHQDSVITNQRTVIDRQQSRLTTGYYIIGTKRDLEAKGIIRREGGFLWGLLGATSVLANGFPRDGFVPINNTTETSIDVKGSVDEIIPKRNPQFYSETDHDGKQTTLRITDPGNFWEQNYLVIVTD